MALSAAIIAVGVIAAAVVLRPAPATPIDAPIDGLLRDRLRVAVIATLKTGAAFHGVLFDVDDRTLILREAQAIPTDGTARIPVDGELVLARGDVEYLQRP